MDYVKIVDDGVLVFIRLTPSAAKDNIGRLEADGDGQMRLKVSVTTVPEKGKANKSLIKLLSKKWRISKSSFEIITGGTARNKTIIIYGSANQLKSVIEDSMLGDTTLKAP